MGKVTSQIMSKDMIDSKNKAMVDMNSISNQVNALSSNLEQKANQTEVRLKTIKIEQTDLSDTLLQQMAGTTPINAVPSDGVVTPQKTTFFKFSKNLFNPNDPNFTTGKAYSGFTDTIVDNASYNLSGYISVNPSDKIFISKNGVEVGNPNYYKIVTYKTDGTFNYCQYYVTGGFTVPVGVNKMRLQLDAGATSLQIEKGLAVTSYEVYYSPQLQNTVIPPITVSESSLDSNLTKKVNPIIKPSKIINDTLFNRTVPTKIKLIGDSITAGAGGTGFNTDGATIPGTTVKINTNGYCWANEFRNLIQNKFNKSYDISATDPMIKYLVSYTSSDIYDNSVQLQNWEAKKAVSLDFYGDAITVSYDMYTNLGIVDIYLDGVKQTSIDAYNTTYQTQTYTITGLTTSHHTLDIYQTYTKNASSSAYTFNLRRFTIKKIASVVNYGVSGLRSSTALDNASNLLEVDDDIVIMQLGTNDRDNTSNIEQVKRHLRKIIKIGYGKNPNMKFILMSSCPSTPTVENDPIRYYSMFEIDKAIKELALEMNMEYISNYDAFLQYVDYRNIDISTLLSDGLHPNDLGYKVMFRNIVRKLGIHFVAEGVTK